MCGEESMFVQVTVSPLLMCKVAGEKAKFWIFTEYVFPDDAGVCPEGLLDGLVWVEGLLFRGCP